MFASTQGLIEWCDEERGEKEEISCLEGGREKSFIETVGSHCSSWVGRGKEWGGGALGREMERGSWRYLTFKNLSNSLEYAARVRLASYLNGIALR